MRKLTQEEFIERANKVHNGKYDYSKVEYINNATKVCIICPIHGEFWQTPARHTCAKQGCQRCYDDRRRTLVLGFGINDSTHPIIQDGKRNLAYKTWTSMIRRCYSEKYHKAKPTYRGCEVCEEWKYFSNFEKWFEQYYREGCALDKDIIVQGNKIYSPETCCFVPPYINGLLATNTKQRGNYKLGVHFKDNRFIVQCGVNKNPLHIGCFTNEDEAHEAYKKIKYAEIKRVASDALAKGDIDKRVYNALLNYKINEY